MTQAPVNPAGPVVRAVMSAPYYGPRLRSEPVRRPRDAQKLARLLREDPTLVRARSTRDHNSTLLHYVSANGLEGFRQKTPKNIVRFKQLASVGLLDQGLKIRPMVLPDRFQDHDSPAKQYEDAGLAARHIIAAALAAAAGKALGAVRA